LKTGGVRVVVLEASLAPIAISARKGPFACTERAMAWGDAFVIWGGHLQAAIFRRQTEESHVPKQAAR